MKKPLLLGALAFAGACQAPAPVHHERIIVEDRAPPDAPDAPVTTAGAARGPSAIFPHVRIDTAARTVEFDGVVPIDAHDPEAPRVYLELIACTPDTREHESLILTRARAAHVHAALLMLGHEPGAPGDTRVDHDGVVFTPPRGSPLSITFRWTDAAGTSRRATPADWIISARSRQKPAMPEGSFVFAGSRMRRHDGAEVYDADGAGTLIGLATFASETIAWTRVFSHDSSISDPEWIADAANIPRAGTPVTVVLSSPANNRP